MSGTGDCSVAGWRTGASSRDRAADFARWQGVPAISDARTANGGFALGNDRFKAQIAEMLKRRVKRAAPGRPKKQEPGLSEDDLRPN
jgi:hypothetical protein